MKKIIMAVIFGSMVFNLMAAEQINENASQVFAFMNIGAGARANAMAGAFTAVGGDASLIAWNPAGLALIKQPEASVTYSRIFVDTNYQYLLGAFPMAVGTAAFNIAYLDYGLFELRDINGAIQGGNATAYDIEFSAAYAMKLTDAFYAGAALKYADQSVDASSISGLAVDFGLQAGIGPVTAGLCVQNAGTAGSYSTPARIKAGVAGAINAAENNDLLLAADFDYLLQGGAGVDIGVEYSYSQTIFLRGGYIFNSNGTGSGTPCAGAGIKYGGIRLDYSAQFDPELGTTNNITLSYSFGAAGGK
jgi:long-subunit fatty acid transport protein